MADCDCGSCDIYKQCASHKHSVYGCQWWQPHEEYKIKLGACRGLDAERPLEKDEPEDDAARGIILRLIVAVIIWAAIIWLVWILF